MNCVAFKSDAVCWAFRRLYLFDGLGYIGSI